jgi:TonB family protein
VRLLIGQDGRVKKARIVNVTGHESFRRAVMDVIYRWRFTRPVRNGQPVQARKQLTIRFELR